ncbi:MULTISPECIES: alpha/beta hydrolase [unclassified Paracoccus (in: a-proteobacteria)]|uniref:alpha/beta hydrolase n=1 Tax=unclassified Paracoccus (in: a-proteobacteria) TaxID=2688777 RepID=UPI0016010224|nr:MULTISPECIES: alpha/beta fold hydrolase [unclassified Paracoccus (in: a-proteobacteria)]MBB1490361.1 alpha/beta fold hydrolase [Paracoccus sp. MC1854]MBB1497203.1 alpha/beta fold hydrolase [Paracoccus sp. MC1862]QQO44822.1 alpha/beta fold hydrolase [Paracoccus sp. MC1862]
MTRELQSDRRGPEKAGSVIVFLHGYGADGADLLGLAEPLGRYLPDTVFYAPNASEPCVNNPFGFQWFPIPWLDGSTEAQARASMEKSIDDVNAFLDNVLAREGLQADRMVVVGFSQGTMMALHVLPRRDKAVAGIVGFSGRLLAPELVGEARVRPPVLLLHGDQDPMVPFADMGLAERALAGAGFDIATHVMPGTGHGISPDGLGAALSFIRKVLGAK